MCLGTLALVIPAHNSSANIGRTVEVLCGYFTAHSLSGQVILVENGSSDDTWEVMQAIATDGLPFELVTMQSAKGLGNAIREGLTKVLADTVLITADDLPFGFSDIDGYAALSPMPDIAIGSKAHPGTRGDRSLGREVMSTVFRRLRRLVVGVNLGDTQGSIMGHSRLISDCAMLTKQSGYLMTTEMLVHAQRKGLSIIELPVVYMNEMRGSNINVVSDSLKMLRGLFEVRASVRRTVK